MAGAEELLESVDEEIRDVNEEFADIDVKSSVASSLVDQLSGTREAVNEIDDDDLADTIISETDFSVEGIDNDVWEEVGGSVGVGSVESAQDVEECLESLAAKQRSYQQQKSELRSRATNLISQRRVYKRALEKSSSDDDE